MEPGSTNYLAIMVLGIGAALAGLQTFPDIRQKHKMFQIIFFVGILTQIGTQVVQYLNVAGTHVAQDRQFAYALFAYTRDDPILLREFARDTPYVIGYRLFKDNPPRFDEARPYFNRSIEKGQFVASSYYMLASIERIQHPDDLTSAMDKFSKAITADKRYSGAYYGRAVAEALSRQPSAALNDLESALMYEEGGLICLSIHEPQEIEKYWGSVVSNNVLNGQFTRLQASCLKR